MVLLGAVEPDRLEEQHGPKLLLPRWEKVGMRVQSIERGRCISHPHFNFPLDERGKR